jgi:hypothetical protein
MYERVPGRSAARLNRELKDLLERQPPQRIRKWL